MDYFSTYSYDQDSLPSDYTEDSDYFYTDGDDLINEICDYYDHDECEEQVGLELLLHLQQSFLRESAIYPEGLIEQDHLASVLSDLRSTTHSNTDIGLLNGGGVIDTIRKEKQSPLDTTTKTDQNEMTHNQNCTTTSSDVQKQNLIRANIIKPAPEEAQDLAAMLGDLQVTQKKIMERLEKVPEATPGEVRPPITGEPKAAQVPQRSSLSKPYSRFNQKPQQLLAQLDNLYVLYDSEEKEEEFIVKIDSQLDYAILKAIVARDFTRGQYGIMQAKK